MDGMTAAQCKHNRRRRSLAAGRQAVQTGRTGGARAGATLTLEGTGDLTDGHAQKHGRLSLQLALAGGGRARRRRVCHGSMAPAAGPRVPPYVQAYRAAPTGGVRTRKGPEGSARSSTSQPYSRTGTPTGCFVLAARVSGSRGRHPHRSRRGPGAGCGGLRAGRRRSRARESPAALCLRAAGLLVRRRR